MKHSLILGGGFTQHKRLNQETLQFDEAHYFNESGDAIEQQTTIDLNKECKPSFVWNLNKTPWPVSRHTDGYKFFDEIHAYEIIEHLGAQGDVEAFFAFFNECYRVLTKGGLLFAACPSYKSIWAWGDPSHTRVINSGSLVFLSRAEYDRQLGKTAMSDYRSLLAGDWEVVKAHDDGNSFRFVLRAK